MLVDTSKLNDQQIYELINQRRRQLLVHSFLYYQLSMTTITDHRYDEFSNDLVELHAAHPDIAGKCIFADEFKDFQTGHSFALPYSHPDVQRWAYGYLRSSESIEKNKAPDLPKER